MNILVRHVLAQSLWCTWNYLYNPAILNINWCCILVCVRPVNVWKCSIHIWEQNLFLFFWWETSDQFILYPPPIETFNDVARKAKDLASVHNTMFAIQIVFFKIPFVYFKVIISSSCSIQFYITLTHQWRQ